MFEAALWALPAAGLMAMLVMLYWCAPQFFDNLVFHGGKGSTLEMREFTETSLKALLAGAGFTDIRIYAEDYPPFGIVRAESWSLPIAAVEMTLPP